MAYYSDLSEEFRNTSYRFIENFIRSTVPDWSKWNDSINTDDVEKAFSERISKMSKKHFEFLLLHSGYIPDYYESDSSQETLYSKLIESLVCEWAKRIGFTNSYLQKQKSSKEDITIQLEDKIIVCDAKSFRLGRSQKAPNVKDTIKKEAYDTWLSAYPEDKRVGGLTTFPSMHDWQQGGDAYHYYTEGNPSIMILFYEQMAFILNQNIKAEKIVDFLDSYSDIFPIPSKKKDVYWNGAIANLFNDNYKDYMLEVQTYLIEKVKSALDTLYQLSNKIKKDINENLKDKSLEELRTIASEALFQIKSIGITGQIENIKNFRLK